MKKIDGSFITTTVGMPFKAGVLAHLQQAYQETEQSIGLSLIGQEYDPTKIYVLYGCLNSGSGLTYIISAGAVLYGGEIFLVDATSFVASAGQVAVGNIGTTFASSSIGDPIQHTDGNNHNVLQIRKMVISAALTGTGISDFANWILVNSPKVQRVLVASFGSGYTVNFRQDQSIFFTTGLNTAGAIIAWDFNGAVPGTVVRLKVVTGSGGSGATFATPGGSQILNEGGTITVSKTNIIYCAYMGVNEGGNNEVSLNIVSI